MVLPTYPAYIIGLKRVFAYLGEGILQLNLQAITYNCLFTYFQYILLNTH